MFVRATARRARHALRGVRGAATTLRAELMRKQYFYMTRAETLSTLDVYPAFRCTSVPCLLLGAAGVGKETAARAAASKWQSEGKLVAVSSAGSALGVPEHQHWLADLEHAVASVWSAAASPACIDTALRRAFPAQHGVHALRSFARSARVPAALHEATEDAATSAEAALRALAARAGAREALATAMRYVRFLETAGIKQWTGAGLASFLVHLGDLMDGEPVLVLCKAEALESSDVGRAFFTALLAPYVASAERVKHAPLVLTSAHHHHAVMLWDWSGVPDVDVLRLVLFAHSATELRSVRDVPPWSDEVLDVVVDRIGGHLPHVLQYAAFSRERGAALDSFFDHEELLEAFLRESTDLRAEYELCKQRFLVDMDRRAVRAGRRDARELGAWWWRAASLVDRLRSVAGCISLENDRGREFFDDPIVDALCASGLFMVEVDPRFLRPHSRARWHWTHSDLLPALIERGARLRPSLLPYRAWNAVRGYQPLDYLLRLPFVYHPVYRTHP